MKTLNGYEYSMLTNICQCPEEALKKALYKFLNHHYNFVEESDDYLFATGTIPVALVAHLDTVFDNPPVDIYYDKDKGVMWSPQGLGADDRAGVYAIITILKNTKLRPTIIFTMGEEMGNIGAEKLIEKFPSGIGQLNYIIELDRRGSNDCVFYSCNNKKFVEYVESFGFIENFGSFSDISSLCPVWGVAGVNLSVGYDNEHSQTEYLNINALYSTIRKVSKMLSEKSIPYFRYIQDPLRTTIKNYDEAFRTAICDGCGQETFVNYMISTHNKNFCPNCMDKIAWCPKCGQPYEVADGHCYYCKDEEENDDEREHSED